MGTMSEHQDTSGESHTAWWRFETLPGFFLQDDLATEATVFDYANNNFGLINRSYDSDFALLSNGAEFTQWPRFEYFIQRLNATAAPGTSYKIIYNGRHGQGDHNVAEALYGTEAWDSYWSKLKNNGTLFWFDAHLTSTGEEQAREAATFFRKQFAWAKMPEPQAYYVSPLFRCLQTARLTFGGEGLLSPKTREFKAVVKEMMREVMGEHTCDMRSPRFTIAQAFREFEIEPGFSEEDGLWQKDYRETCAEHDWRTQMLLQDIFVNDPSVFVSFTSHSGSIASLLRVIVHKDYKVPTGGLIPLFVKGTHGVPNCK